MGLDISAYSHLEFVRDFKRNSQGRIEWGAEEDEDLLSVMGWASETVEPRLFPFAEGYYIATEKTETADFRAGSYGGYNEWRAELCRAALGVEIEEVWHRPDLYQGKPFYELLNFADNEGTIGPATCVKLLGDFKDYQGEVARKFSTLESAEWYLSKLPEWVRAFELGAQNGVVDFH